MARRIIKRKKISMAITEKAYEMLMIMAEEESASMTYIVEKAIRHRYEKFINLETEEEKFNFHYTNNY